MCMLHPTVLSAINMSGKEKGINIKYLVNSLC